MTSRRGRPALPMATKVGVVPDRQWPAAVGCCRRGQIHAKLMGCTVAWRKWAAQSPSPPLVAASALIINHCGRDHLWLLKPASDVRPGATGTEKHRVSSSASHPHRRCSPFWPSASGVCSSYIHEPPPPPPQPRLLRRIEDRTKVAESLRRLLTPSLLSVSLGLWTLRLSG